MTTDCKATTVDFIMKDTNPQLAAVEDDIRKNLADIGITVNSRFLSGEDYRIAETDGDFNIFFGGTWGAPYDPHSYMTSWAVPAHVEYASIGNLHGSLTREALLKKITDVQTELDETKRKALWKEILQDVHSQALFMPLWGTRIPYVINRRLMGFRASSQLYSIPVNTIQVTEGSSTNATIAPGVGGMFTGTGPLNPHQYSPNALWAQDWIYEGLVSYGQDGNINPALATNWTESETGATFKLREGVKFHDGEDWNCDAAKLNFDHVLSDIVRQRHQWFGTGKYLESWECLGDYDLKLTTSVPFYPLVQELTYIRPLRFASPGAFHNGLDSDPDDHNSCEPGGFGVKYDHLEDDVTCKGLTDPIGTGPWKFLSRTEAPDGSDAEALFQNNEGYWGPKSQIQFLKAVQYDDQDQVEDALLSGELDMALGIGPLTAKQVKKFREQHSDMFDVQHSEVVQNSVLVFNSNKAPTDDINVRQAIIHAIDKAAFLEEEFAGLEQPVTQLLPEDAPYCGVDLSPKWGYDFDKAKLLNCPTVPEEIEVIKTEKADSNLGGGAIAGIVIGSLVGVALIAFIARLIKGEKEGKPMFAPIKESPVELS